MSYLLPADSTAPHTPRYAGEYDYRLPYQGDYYYVRGGYSRGLLVGLDPYSLLGLLSFLTFLFFVIFRLLTNNGAGRALGPLGPVGLLPHWPPMPGLTG